MQTLGFTELIRGRCYNAGYQPNHVRGLGSETAINRNSPLLNPTKGSENDCEAIGSEPTLPYLSPELNGERLLIGANFASAGVGILNDTGVQFVNIIRIGRQLEFFQQYQQRETDMY
ncbi:hypothetical protein SAY87_008515 [Trapa incisa]|uniref:Uncharacterized protein n=1 Tax=Trapa incisa TaxID=236973 RepID=A0AAN7PW89_9MYRT|nr:hypothetical protein SAY87_008515 [Trapa incisa]